MEILTLNCGGTRLEIQTSVCGYVEMTFRGPLKARALARLRARAYRYTRHAKGCLLRYDAAELEEPLKLRPLANVENEPTYLMPCALLVSAPEYGEALRYSAEMGRAGLIRAVFRSEQIAAARAWALRHRARLPAQ